MSRARGWRWPTGASPIDSVPGVSDEGMVEPSGTADDPVLSMDCPIATGLSSRAIKAIVVIKFRMIGILFSKGGAVTRGASKARTQTIPVLLVLHLTVTARTLQAWDFSELFLGSMLDLLKRTRLDLGRTSTMVDIERDARGLDSGSVAFKRRIGCEE